MTNEHGRHSIEAGYARGNFWRQAPFVEVGEPVVFNKRWTRHSVIANTVMGDMREVPMGDEREPGKEDEIEHRLVADSMYVLSAFLKQRDGE